jgi:hypothetical protein
MMAGKLVLERASTPYLSGGLGWTYIVVQQAKPAAKKGN